MTISLTLTVEILLGKESDRHLLTSIPLLSEKNRRRRGPLETCLARMPSSRDCCVVRRAEVSCEGEAGCPDSICSFVHLTTPL